MATGSKRLGTVVQLLVNGKRIANCLAHNVSIDSDVIDVSNKDSGGFKEILIGEHQLTADLEGIIQDGGLPSNKISHDTMLGYQLARTLITCRLTNEVAGDAYIEFSAYMHGYQRSEPNNDRATFNCSVTSTGTFTVGAES